jgi:hypothetical protein
VKPRVATADGGSGALPGALGSLPWIDERVVIALESDSRTVRNIIEHGTARLALGPTRDVVVIDAVLDRAVDLDDAPAAPAERYAAQADWDPRTARGRFVFVVLRPDRIQAWREVDELAGRTLMRAGSWLSDAQAADARTGRPWRPARPPMGEYRACGNHAERSLLPIRGKGVVEKTTSTGTSKYSAIRNAR